MDTKNESNETKGHEIYLASGCFWGAEAFVKRLPGIISCEVGYANGNGSVPRPTYEQVCSGTTGCAETVRVTYDPARISLPLLLEAYLSTIDPASLNRQGGDQGIQYRTGVYWTDPADEPVVRAALDHEGERLAARGRGPIVVEARPLANFWPAEDYHQDFLDKNPHGYCHVDLGGAERFVSAHAQDFAQLAAAHRQSADELG